jgi:EpsI family protein
MMFRKWYKVVLFLLSCVAVPLLGNGLRIVGIILLAHYSNNKYGAGADHIIYGWGFNVAILLFLFLLGSFFRDPVDESEVKIRRTKEPDSRTTIATVFLISTLLLSLGPAVAYWHDSRAIAPNIAELRAPVALSSWHEAPLTGLWRPVYPGIDSDLTASFFLNESSTALPVDLYVGYYARARTGHSLTAHLNKLWDDKKWTPVSSGHAVARIGGTDAGFGEWIVTSTLEKRMVWATYWVDGTFTTSLLKVKLLQARAAFGGHEGEAVVVVSTIVDGSDDVARRRLSNALLDLKDLPERLNRTNRRASSSTVLN